MIHTPDLTITHKNVHLYEATDRLGGRHDTHYDERTTDGAQYATFEGGAMRFPPFLSGISQDPALGESVLSYYVNEYNIATEGFPNPGSEYADTGIYYNEGYQEDLTQPELAFWLKKNTQPPTPALQAVYDIGKWNDSPKVQPDSMINGNGMIPRFP